MFFILSKILEFLLSPLLWILIFMFISLFVVKSNTRKLKWMYAAFFMLIFFTNPFLNNLAIKAWEVPGYPSHQIKKPYTIGILLSGSMKNFDTALDRPSYSHSVDRLLQTISLYKTGKINKILLTGGSGYVLNPEFRESSIIKSYLIEVGIPEVDIIVEDQSRNTYENAIFTALVLKEHHAAGNLLLITSAFHMRRSLACFNKAGVKVYPFPVDMKSRNLSFRPDQTIIPDDYCLSLWKMLIKEWIGVIAYKFKGYI